MSAFASKKLFEQENALLSNVLERITDPFISLDKNWCYTYVNKSAGKFLNRDPGELIGKNIWAEFPEFKDHPFQKACEKALEKQQYIHFEEYHPPGDRWLENHIYPSADGLSIYSRDITSGKKAAKELYDNKAFVETIINSSPDIIYIYDIEEGKNVYVNEGIQLNLGYSDSEIKQMGNQILPLLMHPDDFKQYLLSTFPRYADMKDKEVITDEFRLKDKEGKYHWFSSKESIFSRKPDGTPKQIFGINTDITEQKKIDEYLQLNEHRLRLIYDTTADPLFLLDVEENGRYQFISVNNAFLSATGLKNEQVLNSYVDEIIPPSSLPIVLEKYKEAIATKKSITWEEVSEYPAGKKIGIVTVTPFFNTNGSCTQLVGTVHDISERKEAEEALAKSEAEARILFDESPIIIWEEDFSDIKKRLEYIRRSGVSDFEKYFDEHEEEVHHLAALIKVKNVNKKSLEFYRVKNLDSLVKHVPSWFIDESWDVFKKEVIALANNQLKFESEIPVRAPEGTPMHLIINLSIPQAYADNWEKVLVSFIDITERKRAEEELVKEKDISDQLINSLPGVFYFYNREGKFIRWNKNFEVVTGYTTEEIKNMHPLDFFDEPEKKLLKEKIQNVFVAGEDNVEANFMAKSGKKTSYYFTGKVIEYENEDCLMGVGIDISRQILAQEEIKQASEQLRKLAGHLQTVREKERKRIAREIHDELGQQLTAIKMDLAWIDKKTPESLNIIKSKIRNVNTLLDGSNQAIRRILNELRIGILDGYGLGEALKRLGLQFTENTGIPVEFTGDEIKVKVEETIATCLFRVYQEALTNITRYANAKKVTSSLSHANNQLTLMIRDDGAGFDTEILKSTRSFGILGMRERVAAVNGEFEIQSAQGKGTLLTIKIPYHI